MNYFRKIISSPNSETIRLILGLIVLALATALPATLMAGEKGKTDGCLTSLYNYPVEVQRAFSKKPLISLNSQNSKKNHETKKTQNSTPPSPQN